MAAGAVHTEAWLAGHGFAVNDTCLLCGGKCDLLHYLESNCGYGDDVDEERAMSRLQWNAMFCKEAAPGVEEVDPEGETVCTVDGQEVPARAFRFHGQGEVYSDGSAKGIGFPQMARAAGAVCQHHQGRWYRLTVRLPRWLKPSAVAAEWWAACRGSQFMEGGSTLVLDCAAVLRGIGHQEGRGDGTDHSDKYAGMHRLAEFGRISRLVKIQAHRSKEQALREDGHLRGWEGNDEADRAAKVGLPMVADEDSARYVRQFRSRVRLIRGTARWLAARVPDWRKHVRPRQGRQAGTAEGPRHDYRWVHTFGGWLCRGCGSFKCTAVAPEDAKLCPGPAAKVLEAHKSHMLFRGVFGARDEVPVTWCSKCGYYTSMRVRLLQGACPGSGVTGALKCRKERLNGQVHPVTREPISDVVRVLADRVAPADPGWGGHLLGLAEVQRRGPEGGAAEPRVEDYVQAGGANVDVFPAEDLQEVPAEGLWFEEDSEAARWLYGNAGLDCLSNPYL